MGALIDLNLNLSTCFFFSLTSTCAAVHTDVSAAHVTCLGSLSADSLQVAPV